MPKPLIVTVIEFFDYRCGYCKRVAGMVTQLQKDEPGVRVVYKDFPILGEASVFAARTVLARSSARQTPSVSRGAVGIRE